MQLSVKRTYKQALTLFISVNNDLFKGAIKRQLISFLSLCILLASQISTQAQASNITTTEVFPRAELLEESDFSNIEYRLVISGLKRKRAETSGEVERLIKGEINRQFWQISTNHDVDQVMEYFLKQWNDEEIIYRCKGLDCGSSNFWANSIFENAKLYGRDANQAYVVAKIAGDPTKIYVLYAVQRSKNKLYFNLDQITTTDSISGKKIESQELLMALKKDSGWLNGFSVVDGRIDEKASAVLLDTLKNLDVTLKRRLNLIVHCYHANSMSENLSCSNRLAQQLRAAVYQNIEIPVFGQGALTLPVGNNLTPQVRFILWPSH